MKRYIQFTRNNLYITLVICCCLFAASSARAEHLFLKNGKIITGKIINENAARFTVRTDDGKTVTAERAEIMRTQYANIYLGRQFVRLTDGRVVESYLVEEDQDSYTFRKELYNPEEFTVPRSKVLFFARSNPSNLEGMPDTDSISLRWDPPYKAPKYYKVYLKQEGQPRFNEPVKINAFTYRITGLKTKTKYRVKVTAIDKEDNESLPSNEVSLFTNIPPAPPSVRRADSVSKDGKELKVKLSWKAVRDRDGRIVKYNIYILKEVEFKKVGDTEKLEYIVNGLDPKKKYNLIVRSVDDNGAESPYDATKPKYRFSILAAGYYAMPLEAFDGTLKPFLSFNMFIDTDFYTAGPFFLGGTVAGSYLLQKSTPAMPLSTLFMASRGAIPMGKGLEKKSSIEMTVWGLWGGFNIGFRPAKIFSIGVRALVGYARTEMVRNELFTTKPVSNDLAFMAALELRFGMIPGVFVSILPSYSRVFYSGKHLSEIHLGGGIGCQFDI